MKWAKEWMGELIKEHTIGEYTIYEYMDKFDNQPRFIGAINGKMLNEAWASLDIALLAVISRKYEKEINSQAVHYICNMIGIV